MSDNALAGTIAERVEQFVRTAGAVAADDPGFGRDVELFDAGYLDSLGVVRLTLFLESTFGITLDDGILLDPQFTTIAGISTLLSRRLSVLS